MINSKAPSLLQIDEFFDNLSIEYPSLARAIKIIEDKMTTQQVPSENDNFLIVGESRVGKSHIIKRFRQKYQQRIENDRRVIPVIFAELTPNKAALGSLYKNLLRELHAGDRELKGKLDDQRYDVIRRARLAQTQLITIDEFQHVVSKNARSEGAANALKGFLNNAKIPMLFCGTKACLRLFDTSVDEDNEQLRLRFAQIFEFEPFVTPAIEPQGDFFQFIFGIDDALETLFGERSYIMDDEFLYRIYAASRGKAGLVLQLVKAAAKRCSVRGDTILSIGDFQQALDTDCGFLKRRDCNLMVDDLNLIRKLPREPKFEHQSQAASRDLRIRGIARKASPIQGLKG